MEISVVGSGRGRAGKEDSMRVSLGFRLSSLEHGVKNSERLGREWGKIGPI